MMRGSNTQKYPTTILVLFLLSVHKISADQQDQNPIKKVQNHATTHHPSYKRHTDFTVQMGEASNENLKKFEEALRTNSSFTSINDLNEANDRSFFDFPSIQKFPPSCQPRWPAIRCNGRSRYRTMDGTCNNLRNSFWGASFTFFSRLVPSSYEDGYNAPRGGYRSRLPNPRKISTEIHPDLILSDESLTNMVPQVGQFLDHDLTLAPESDYHCCGSDKGHVDCWPIEIPGDDPFYSQKNVNQSCLAFTRSTPFCFPFNGGIRSQMNSLTAFVDASQVYGSDDIRGKQLREFSGGRLLSNDIDANFLPTVEQVRVLRKREEKIEIMGTYAAGDDRVNEMPALTVLHTLLFREHNRLANQIQRVRPQFSDERIFQNARRILIAQWQNIVYGEYLPIILGPQVMARYELTLQDPIRFSQYDERTNPTIFHSFATAAYRFGHSMINGLIRMLKDSRDVGTYRIRDGFFNDSLITTNGGAGYDWILGGLMEQNSQTYDRFVTQDLTNFLLRDPINNFGSDLLARNVQRGRDHGLQPYHSYRRICSLSPLTDWSRIPPEFDQVTWTKLRSLYRSPLDIDLFTGGLAEIPLRGAVTGPTFNCLKAIQFQRLKFGDRFFFTHQSQTGSFTLDQITKIRRVSLSDLICRNSQVGRTPQNVFHRVSPSNPWINCDDGGRREFLNVAEFL